MTLEKLSETTICDIKKKNPSINKIDISNWNQVLNSLRSQFATLENPGIQNIDIANCDIKQKNFFYQLT